MGLIPKQTKADTKIIFGLTFRKIIGIVVMLNLSSTLGSWFVHSKLNIIFMITNIIIFLWLNTSDKVYPKRPLWKGMLVWLSDKFKPKHYLSLIGNAFFLSYKYEISERNKENVKIEKSNNDTSPSAK